MHLPTGLLPSNVPFCVSSEMMARVIAYFAASFPFAPASPFVLSLCSATTLPSTGLLHAFPFRCTTWINFLTTPGSTSVSKVNWYETFFVFLFRSKTVTKLGLDLLVLATGLTVHDHLSGWSGSSISGNTSASEKA